MATFLFALLYLGLSFSHILGITLTANVTVSMDGNGEFRIIDEAIQAAPNGSLYRYVILIKKGVYKEAVRIGAEKSNLTLIGEGIDATVITNNRSNSSGHATSDSATLEINGYGFLAVNLTIENTSGPNAMQAVALLSNSDQAVFYKCAFKGYQDTLYVGQGKHFFRECFIYGTIDFIFGRGPAVFQNCHILARQALHGQQNAIAANEQENSGLNIGFSFHNCSVTGDHDLLSSKTPTPTYLGRPWRAYARTIFMESYFTWVVSPEGWLRWLNQRFDSTVFYGEYRNSGAGAKTRNRVKWPGVHPSLDIRLANRFTVSKFIQGDEWLPAIGVPFVGGLIGARV